jgi:hypothetical protein
MHGDRDELRTGSRSSEQAGRRRQRAATVGQRDLKPGRRSRPVADRRMEGFPVGRLAGCIRVPPLHPATYLDAGSSDSDQELKVTIGQLEFGP